MAGLERRLESGMLELVDHNLERYTPGLCLQVIDRGRLKADVRLGKTYKYYDLASLTKPIFTVSSFIDLVDRQGLNLNQTVQSILPWWPHSHMTLKQVLTHTAGLPWWRPYFKVLNRRSSRENRWLQLQKKLMTAPLRKENKAIYSDLDFLLLAFVLEELYQDSLLNIWKQIKKQLSLKSADFHVNNQPRFSKSVYAPTIRAEVGRQRLQGQVNDYNASALGGVSTHAGLFGTVSDVTDWALQLRRAYVSERGSSMGRHKTVRYFCRRAIPSAQGDWALGLMKPTLGSSSCGRYFSASSVGHTGFTGTSVWFDPRRDLIVSLVSNRVNPPIKGKEFSGLRPRIHDLVVKTLESL